MVMDFCLLLKIWVNISKNLSSKYSQKIIGHAKQSATIASKTASTRAIQKTTEATGGLIDNKIADRTTKATKTLPHNNSEIVTNEEENIVLDREIPRERYISPEKRQQIINDLRLI